MACRLVNLHTQPLRIDLRGGGVLVLQPGARSPALREELLYDNPHLADWERAGWLGRQAARMSEVRAQTAPAKKAAAPTKKATHKTAPADSTRETPARDAAAKRTNASRRGGSR
jgi:hypothetical protein